RLSLTGRGRIAGSRASGPRCTGRNRTRRGRRVTAGDWSQLGFARIAELLAERAGLVFPATRRPAAEQSMRRVMEQAGELDSRRLARRLQDDQHAFDTLLAEVTVGETYFFREPAQLEFIRRDVLPQLRSGNPSRSLRIWSAGCAAGE